MPTENERPTRDQLWRQACKEQRDRIERASRYVRLLIEHGYLDYEQGTGGDGTISTET